MPGNALENPSPNDPSPNDSSRKDSSPNDPSRHDSSRNDPKPNDPWPELAWSTWQQTATTLHMWLQIVGKTRLALTPLQNHWWNVPLYVSAHGLTTSPMPVTLGSEHPADPRHVLEIEFDFLAHLLHLRLSTGAALVLPLRPQPVAAFFAEYKAALASLGITPHLDPMPVELPAPIRFDLDHAHASYDRAAVERFHRILLQSDTLFKRFSTGFLGKISPVHFFWGSFDLCVTRFSGRPAPPRPTADRMQQEAYSHEVISAGFWPGNGGFGAPAFYCYAAPVPPGLAQKHVAVGTYDHTLNEFILRYDDARLSASPPSMIMDFLQSTYSSAADSAHWDRAALERPLAVSPRAANSSF